MGGTLTQSTLKDGGLPDSSANVAPHGRGQHDVIDVFDYRDDLPKEQLLNFDNVRSLSVAELIQ